MRSTIAVFCLAIAMLAFAGTGSCAASAVDPYADEVTDSWGGDDGFLGGWDKGNYNIPVSPDVALGPPDGWFVSILPGDWIILRFTDNTMIDGPGNDLAIREIGNNQGLEKVDVWVSAYNDGVDFTYLGRVASEGWGVNPTLYLDLEDIGFTDPVGYVKFTDGIGGAAPGFDLDAIWALNAGVPIVEADIDFDPDTLNLKSKGRWATVYIELPRGYDVEDIDASTVLLEDTISPVLIEKYGFVAHIPSYIVDHDGDGIMERMLKFKRSEIHAIVSPGTYNFKVTGDLEDGMEFEGYSDPIEVIDPGQKVKRHGMTGDLPTSGSHSDLGTPTQVPVSGEVFSAGGSSDVMNLAGISHPQSSEPSEGRASDCTGRR